MINQSSINTKQLLRRPPTVQWTYKDLYIYFQRSDAYETRDKVKKPVTKTKSHDVKSCYDDEQT